MKKILLLSLLILFSCSKEDNSALIDSYTTQINSLKTQLAESQSEIRKLLTELNFEITVTIPGLQSGISSLEDTIDNLNLQIDTNNDLIASLQEQIEANKPFDVNSMDIVKYPLYNKDTLSGKKVDTKQLNFYFFTSKGLDIRDINLESNLEYLASENFIVYWDKRYDHTNYAIDILRWSEFSAIKAVEMGMPKPKDFDTYRMNIFITRDDEYGEDIFPGTNNCQCAHTVWNSTNDTNGRRYMTFPWYNNFIEGQTQLENYPRMAVPHEVFHTFQKNNRKWLSESTAEYFEGKLFAEMRPQLLRFIPDFLMSTHFKLWSGYDNNGNGEKDDDDIRHIYGKQLLWYYLDWNGHIDNNFIGRLNSDTSGVSRQNYIIQNISNFRDLYFDFTMKSTVVDFPKWSDKILYLLNQNFSSISRYDGYKRHELILKTNNNQITKIYDEYNYNGEFISPSVNVEPWGFISYKIQSESDNNYKIEIETEHTKYRLGVIVNRNNEYQYYEINSGDIVSFINNDMVYVVIVDIPDSNYTNVDNADPFRIKFSLQE